MGIFQLIGDRQFRNEYTSEHNLWQNADVRVAYSVL